MPTTVIMSREFSRELTGRKMKRDSYRQWKENERAALERARELKRCGK